MADGIEILRRQYQRVVTANVGRGPKSRRQIEAEPGWDGQDHLLLKLPVETSALNSIQDAATGMFAFMFDFSAFDGPSAWV